MKTIAEVKSHPDFMCSLEMRDFRFKLYLIYQGKENLKYIAFYDGKKLFEGEDFKPSPLCMGDSLKCIVACLGMLTLKPGDTDKEYFEKYTPLQMEFSRSATCEELNCYVSMFEDKNCKHHAHSKAFFSSCFSN